MDKYKKTQILKLVLVAALLVVTPLLSTSHRSTYLYFVVNILIIVVGAESGLLSFPRKSPENKKTEPIHPDPDQCEQDKADRDRLDRYANKPVKFTVEKCPSDKTFGAVKDRDQKVKKCSSVPSIFFIEAGDDDHDDDRMVENNCEREDGELVGEVISGQELYQQAETLIGNFYKQLKMQREASWKKLHDHLYHKAF